MKNCKTLTPANIQQRIESGELLVVYDRIVLKLDNWVDRHPGGKLVVQHMVGKDATIEMNANHSKETIKIFKGFQIGCIDTVWKNLVPPIQTFSKITESELQSTLTNTNEIVNKMQVKTKLDQKSLENILHDLLIMKQNGNLSEKEIIDTVMTLNDFPSIDIQHQVSIVKEFQILARIIEEKGLYECYYKDYLKECARYSVLVFVSVYFFCKSSYKWSAFFLGLFWHQITFTAHDAGHNAITHNLVIDTLIGTIIASLLCGMSLDWWKFGHNVHHIVTNQPEHDPDIQHLPVFAVSDRFLQSIFSTYYGRQFKFNSLGKFFVKIQQITYYPILCLGRFNLMRLSYRHILVGDGSQAKINKKFRLLEFTMICIFWYWFGYLLLYKSLPDNSTRLAYLLISMIVPMPLHIQITLSHFAMSTIELGPSESFPQRQLRTTMDVLCPAFFDFIHGGLQFQAIHHLFPRIPRHRLRECVPLVKNFCEKIGVEYKTFTFSRGNAIVMDKLGEISRQI